MRKQRAAVVLSLVAGLACSSAEPTPPPRSGPIAPAESGKPLFKALASAVASAMANAPPSAAPSSAPEAPPAGPPPISLAEALDITFPAGAPAEAERCKAASGADDAKIRCLLGVRFTGDDAAKGLALGLYDKLGTVTGVGRDQMMDGGWRGEIHLVPELPVDRYRKHLQWVKGAFEDIDAFFNGLDGRRPPGTRSTYRYRTLALRFIRSVGRTTPSAYAQKWEVTYNVSGSLHSSAEAVTETLFHEIFHTNDASHRQWSERALSPIADGILAKCGQKTACLAPYAPGTTMVRGGTYYAFQKGNGVWEYAAELATRYFLEHQAILKGSRHGKAPFKCGPAENKKAWDALVEEFFGVDLTGDCPTK